MCTTMIALVRGVMASSIRAGSMHHVSRSTSTGTGVAPVSATTFAETIKVKVGMRTSSPGPMFRDSNARCNAAVPLLHATPYEAPQ